MNSVRITIAGHHFLSVDDFLKDIMPEAQVVRVSTEELKERIKDIDVLIPNMCQVNNEVLAAAHKLRLVQQWGAGLDMVDKDTATSYGIAVANVPTAGTGNAESVAEWCVMSAIAISRRIPLLRSQIEKGGPWGSPSGQALLGKTAGIIGLGGIGKALALRLKPFRMRLVGVKRDPGNIDKEEYGLDWVGGMDDLPQLLRASDYVFLCVPLVKETQGLLGSREIATMPRGAYLINAARGGVINRSALFGAIDNEHLAGAALDVFWQEPVAPDDPDLLRPQILATPHIAGVTDLSYRSIAARVVENIRRVMKGQLPLNCVNSQIELMPEWEKRINII